jgi:hypothetical protein
MYFETLLGMKDLYVKVVEKIITKNLCENAIVEIAN